MICDLIRFQLRSIRWAAPRGPGPPMGPTRAAWACAGWAHTRCGSGRLPGGPASGGFSARLFAPLRCCRAASLPSPRRGRRPRSARRPSLPPAPSVGPCARCRAPRALPGPVCLRPRPCCAAASLIGRPCCARAWALCSALPRGGPLGPLRASAAPAPPRPPGGPGGPLCPPPGAGASFLRAGPLGPACASLGLPCAAAGCSPLRPPAPPPPLGAPGCVRLALQGACGPPPGCCFSQPSPAAPPGGIRAPGAPIGSGLTVRKLSTWPTRIV